MSRHKVPQSLQGVLWSTNVRNLDLEKDKEYIIHHVLTYGNLEQIKWLSSVYSKSEIKEVFKKRPQKIYTPSSFNFVKNYLLSITEDIPAKNYVKAIS